MDRPANPGEIGVRHGFRRQGDDFRNLVGMAGCEGFGERRVGRAGGFDQGEDFGGVFDLSLPAVDGFHAGDQIDACRQLLSDEFRAKLPRRRGVRESAKHNDERVHAPPDTTASAI